MQIEWMLESITATGHSPRSASPRCAIDSRRAAVVRASPSERSIHPQIVCSASPKLGFFELTIQYDAVIVLLLKFFSSPGCLAGPQSPSECRQIRQRQNRLSGRPCMLDAWSLNGCLNAVTGRLVLSNSPTRQNASGRLRRSFIYRLRRSSIYKDGTWRPG
jgi:hypothetical protein